MGKNKRALTTAAATAALLVGALGATSATAQAAAGKAPARIVNGPLVTATRDNAPYGVCGLTATDPTTHKITDLTPAGAGCSPAASPDSKLLAYIGTQKPFTGGGPGYPTTPEMLHVMNRDGSHSRIIYRLPNSSYTLYGDLFTPDGAHLLFDVRNQAGATQLYRIGLDGRGMVKVGLGFAKGDDVVPLAYSSDGRTLAADVNGNLWLEKGTGKPYQPKLPARPGYLMSACFSPDGKEIAYSADGTDYITNLVTGKSVVIAKPYQDSGKDDFTFDAVAFSPDGKKIMLIRMEDIYAALGGYATALETANVSSPTKLIQSGPTQSDGEVDDILWLPATQAAR